MITVTLDVITHGSAARCSPGHLPNKGQAEALNTAPGCRVGAILADLHRALLKMHFLALGSIPSLCSSDSTPIPDAFLYFPPVLGSG